MPKGFSPSERDHLEKELYAAGLKLFSTMGLKKTSIADITKKVGIAQGSFYLFFQSKEELYFRILGKEEALLKETLQDKLAAFEKEPARYIKELITHSLALMAEHPILLQLYTENGMEALIRKLPPELMAEHFKDDNAFLFPLFDSWRELELVKPIAPELITSLLRSVFLITLHKKEIGEEYFEDTISLLAEMIGNGITRRIE